MSYHVIISGGVLVYVTAWLAVVFGINSTSNAGVIAPHTHMIHHNHNSRLSTGTSTSDLQSRRDRFRHQKTRELEVVTLQKAMKFVDDYLKKPSVLRLEDRDQNALTYEVSFSPTELILAGWHACWLSSMFPSLSSPRWCALPGCLSTSVSTTSKNFST